MPTSTSIPMTPKYDADRMVDELYAFLVGETPGGWDRIVQGVYSMVNDRSRHPAVIESLKHAKAGDRTLQRAILLVALYIEPEFFNYMCERPGIDASALSQFVVDVLPPIITLFLNGEVDLQYCVSQCTLAYITM